MSINNLTAVTKISQAITIADGAAGATAVTGATIDMSGFESVLVAVMFGPIVSGAVTSFKIQGGNASDMSDAADLLGTGQTIADTDDNKTFYADIIRPMYRYVRVVVSRATQNATCAALYTQYGARKPPVTHGTGVTGELHQSPAAGTA